MRGSLWRKWDLHIHTPESFQNSFTFLDQDDKNQYDGNIWDKYIDNLESNCNISVLGITDYFSVSGYKKILEYRRKGRLTNIDLILPNIEFRLDTFVNDTKRLNYHVIFSDKLGFDYIERNFLERLEFNDKEGIPIPLTKINIESIGKKLKKEHANFVGSDYFVGCMNITIDFDDILKILKNNPNFKGKYILVAANDLDELGWDGQGHLTRKSFLTRSDAMFSSNIETRKFLLGEKHSTPSEYLAEFKAFKPCIHGSDAHSFEDLCKPDEDRYCWIKADTTFEGLKQIMYEPADRVRVTKNKPEDRKNIHTIDQIGIYNSQINTDLILKEGHMDLNRNLIVVTGGKGSGKTALLDLVANCYENRCKDFGIDKNSFVQRIEKEKSDLITELSFIGPSVENFSKELIENKFFKSSKITYLPQGKIEDYSGDREKLDDKIKEIIFNNKDVKEKGYEGQYDSLDNNINNIYKEIEENSWKINELKKETSETILTNINSELKFKEGELKDKQEEFVSISKNVEEDITEKITHLKDEESSLHVKHSKLWRLKENLEEIKLDLESFLDNTNPKILNINKILNDVDIQIEIPRIDIQNQIKDIIESLISIDENVKNIAFEIKSKEDNLKKLSGVKESYIELIDEIEQKKKEIFELETRIDNIYVDKQKIEKIKKDIIVDYYLLISIHFEQRDYYEEIIKTFSGDTEDILGGIEFKSSIYFDKVNFVKLGLDIFDRRRIKNIVDEIEEKAFLLESLITNEDLNGIEDFVVEAMEMEQYLKETRSISDLNKWIFGNYFSLSTEINFNEISMDKLSMGQKGTVLLKLFLAEGDYPLIIDQPEDNLDNRFIYTELVQAFKDAKKKRQIIIATNNANLVVNADAEQIIIAEFKNYEISYNSGSIENLKTRNIIMPILEGGEVAFREREQKYGI